MLQAIDDKINKHWNTEYMFNINAAVFEPDWPSQHIWASHSQWKDKHSLSIIRKKLYSKMLKMDKRL